MYIHIDFYSKKPLTRVTYIDQKIKENPPQKCATENRISPAAVFNSHVG